MAAAPAALTSVSSRFAGLRQIIGNTPLLEIAYRHNGRRRTIFAKAEYLNITGSIKDRMALHILKRAYEQGRLRPGDTIAEATSGNSGISFAAIGRALGHPVVIFMPDGMSSERVAMLRSLGARIVLVGHEHGGFLGCMRMSEELAEREPNVFLPRQFSNSANVESESQTTGAEIWWQLQGRSLAPTAFVAGVGTGGTIMGVGQYLRERNPTVRVHPLEAAESPTLSLGHKVGRHRIQGLFDEFVPEIVHLGELDHVLKVHDGDAILMAQKLASELGLAVGISSGANFLGAAMVCEDLGDDAIVATVFPDDNKKYLSTDLLKEEPVREEYLSPAIELRDFTALRRVCFSCFEPPA